MAFSIFSPPGTERAHCLSMPGFLLHALDQLRAVSSRSVFCEKWLTIDQCFYLKLFT
jgi:hypothetical protein